MPSVTLASLADAPIDIIASNGNALTLRPGGGFKLPVVLANNGGRPFSWSHQNPLHLSYRWLDQDGEFVERDGLRTILPVAPLAPGSRVEVEMVGASPEREGRYLLQLSLVLEGVHWACDVASAGWLQIIAQVASAPAWPAELRASRGARALRGAMAAAELARHLEGRSFAVVPAPTNALAGAELNGTAAPAPSSTALRKRQPVFRRLRSWLRGALGVRGLELQLQEVLAQTSRHEQHVRDLEIHMLSLREASRIELEAANDRAHRLSEQISEARVELSEAFTLSGLAAKRQTTQIEDVSGKLETLGSAQHEIRQELREGSVVVELISNIRQLIAWAQSAGDLGVIAQVSETVQQLIDRSDERAPREAAHRETLDLQLVSNSLKIDALLTRQTIPLATAGVILVRNRFGMLAIQDDDAPAIAYYSTGELPEPATVAIVERLLEPGDCFLDVGANVGIYSLIAGRRVGPGGKVVSVEPSPSTMRALRTMLSINGIASVTQTHECALGSAEGTATLHCEPTSGHNSLVGPTKNTRTTHNVAVKRGEALLNGLKPALIKIDVEGWELDVLEGLESVIKGTKRLGIVVEFSPGHVRGRGMQPDEWIERVKAFGLKMWVIDDFDISLRPFEKANEVVDRGANLFLSRTLPPALTFMLHGK
jgi:FkbM family methyltransferase